MTPSPQPVLAYAVIPAQRELPPLTGVTATPVGRIEAGPIAGLYSAAPDTSAGASTVNAQAALQFHAVLRQVFEVSDLIPFRFPTVLQSAADFESELTSNGSWYEENLRRLAGCVQLEVLLSHADAGESVPRSSGTAYLRARQSRSQALASALAETLSHADGSIGAIREQRQAVATDQLRCFLLVGRQEHAELKQRLTTGLAHSRLPGRVTGPWPATAFLSPWPQETPIR